MVEHRIQECVGEWRLLIEGEDREIGCTRCGAAYSAFPVEAGEAAEPSQTGRFLRGADQPLVSHSNRDFDDAA